ncbi:26424_t:CDS:2 [Racocetra persica]|uniref:26424_t:CDS:1 n=2 Tax=Racocetra persica TaxID=160502 RepID=A0ACA9LKX4_9GLOM|nr:26421_t:CDS:2 [Racocetra persica]CAG8529618.1 26424_t:CDS:2 [Racocetra persica]
MEILIPSKFTVVDEDYEFKTIELGNDSNENLENVGMSATQSCREYQFDLGDMIIRFIDRTHYRPGDIFPALKEQLPAFKNGVKFCKIDETGFTESWKRSVAESVRLFEYLCLQQLIQTNVNLIKDRQKEIDSCTEFIQDLKKRLYIPQQYLDSKKHRMICTGCNYECVSGKINYKSHCHEHCYLNEVEPGLLNNAALLNCWDIQKNGTCCVCGCNYGKHMHITYEFDYKTKNIIDESVERQINDKKAFQHTKESTIRDCEQRRKQLESEQKIITKINIIFVKFLRQSAIATFNDSYSEYLDHFIREERIKHNAIIEGPEKTKREYQEKIEVIKKALAANDSSEDLITQKILLDMKRNCII